MKRQGPAAAHTVIGAAGEVFRWLHLAIHIMEHGQIPPSYNEIKAEWNRLLNGLRNGDFDPYHRAIRKLFKQEYALRNCLAAEGSPLPTEKPAFAAFTAN